MEIKNYALGTLTVFLLLSLGIQVDDDATHICRDRQITYHCDSFSKYYSLDNGKCINNIKSNKLCSSGWEEIQFEEIINEQDDTAMKVCCHTDGTCTDGACYNINI